MIPLEKLQSVLGVSTTAGFTTTNFLDIHRHVEGYLKRVIIIGLRLKGVQYKNAEFIVKRIQIDISTTIEKSWFLLDRTSSGHNNYINGLKSRHPDLFVLKETFVGFSSKYRNQVAHGIVGQISSQDAIDLLCHVDLSFYKKIEIMLKTEHGHSAFDSPRIWGASRGIDEPHVTTAERLGLGRRLSIAPQKITDVKNALAATRYPVP